MPSRVNAAVAGSVLVSSDLLQQPAVQNASRAVVPQQGVLSRQLYVLSDLSQTHPAGETNEPVSDRDTLLCKERRGGVKKIAH